MTADDFLIPAQDSQAATLLPRSSSFSRVPSIPVLQHASFPLPACRKRCDTGSSLPLQQSSLAAVAWCGDDCCLPHRPVLRTHNVQDFIEEEEEDGEIEESEGSGSDSDALTLSPFHLQAGASPASTSLFPAFALPWLRKT